MRLEVVLVAEVLADETVVVDLTVDGEGEGAIIVDEGLGTRVLKDIVSIQILKWLIVHKWPHTDTDDAQTLVRENYKSRVSIQRRHQNYCVSTH